MKLGKRRISPTMLGLIAAIFALQLLSSGTAVFFLREQMADVVQATQARQILDVRDDLLAAYYEGGRLELAEYITERKGSAGDPAVFIALTGQGATVLDNLSAVPDLAVTEQPVPVTVHRADGKADVEGTAVAGLLPDGGKLVVGVMGATGSRLQFAFAAALGLTIVVAVLLALTSAVLIGIVISRRTHQIAETASQLGSGNFQARLPTTLVGDGFDHLRSQMNLMAERIDSLVTQLSSISGSLAHDLRSPVARLTAALDTALTHAAEPVVIEALQTARTDADGLRRMLETALEIGQLDGGTIVDRRVTLDLSHLAEDLIELYEPLADQSGITLDAHLVTVNVRADRELISRALANLIDNALKYGGPHISVTTRATADGGEITVADDGPGIAPEDRDRAVERFVRLDNARTLPGGGLGLAMVDAVARYHGGSLTLSGESGLIATLHLPR